MSAVADDVVEEARPRPASVTELFFAFNRLALQGFGGVLPVAQRELVERRRWVTRAEFVEILSLGQVLPGPNVVNLALMTLSLLAWPLAKSTLVAALVIVPWGLACFSMQSMQQARLGAAAPLLAPALMALNTSAIYLGQAAGAAGGGWLIAHQGYGTLSFAGLGWLAVARMRPAATAPIPRSAPATIATRASSA